jgi:polar amino acid transport system permease protein
VLFGPPGEFGGFALNILVSFLAMAIGTVSGLALGLGLISRFAPVRSVAWAVTQFFRNSPWLVLLFFVMLLTPFQIQILGLSIPLPAWLKATVGLALPIMANIAEIVRGAVNSIPTAQWESAESLAFTRLQTLWRIILPQCVKRMIPPWMNWYAILTMATPLISIVGVNDAMTLTQDALASEQRTDLLMPMYGLLLLFFFVYCYPIARWTIRLERKYAVRI